MVIKALGGDPNVVRVSPGLWLYNYSVGMAVFVQDGAATVFRVMAPTTTAQTGAGNQALPRPESRSSVNSAPSNQSSGPAVVIEDLHHNLASTVQIIGAVRNVSRTLKYRVTVSVSAKTFREVPLLEKRMVVAEELSPGQRAAFVVELDQDLVQSYRVRVDLSPRTGEPLDAVTGSILQGEYASWALEDLSKYASASAQLLTSFERPNITRHKLKITYRASFPRYAKIKSIWIRVGPGSRGQLVQIKPETGVTEIPWGSSSSNIELTVVRVEWELDF
jgi:hypothetical protein